MASAAVAPEVMAPTKSLDDVKADMSDLYEQVRRGAVDLKVASELANITGKFLKAEQLKLAREIFASNGPKMIARGNA